ncbi:MAG: hypothetical protein NC097_03480 [Clostridium sp.]|nr:hypothetical protein [Prevotella sp.]MCM1428839.1 hypothetical protein [Clostridium sp.]MCM1475214.1 hypothetical protein [Muribaculaceae bacterium]
MKKIFLIAAMTAMSVPAIYADDFTDDIYFDPRKQPKEDARKKAESYYIPDYQNQDIDAYNMRGQYYYTPIDTIGYAVENGEDFVYTQKIQKFYNPTIVVDNSGILSDVLANSYGNVDIVYNYGNPFFLPYYGYGSWSSLLPTISIGSWGWNVSWGNPFYSPWYDPWYSYTPWTLPWYRPSWTWGPAWTWGPSWSWGGWHPSRPHYADYRPGGLRPTGPRPGWSSAVRPGSHHANVGVRPGGNVHRPSNAGSIHRPGNAGNVRPGNAGNVRPGNAGNVRPGNAVVNPGNGHRYTPGSVRPVTPSTPAVKPQVAPSAPVVKQPSSPSNQGSRRGGYTPSNNSNRGSYTPSNNNSNRRSYTPSNNSNRGSSPSFNNRSNRGGYGGGARGGARGGGGHRR